MQNNPNQRPPANLDEKAVKKQLLVNWIKTFFGIGVLGSLAVGVLWAVGFKFSIIFGLLGLFGVALPIFSWYNSATLVKRMMRCQTPNPANKNHMRLVRLVDELYPLTGLKKKPEVMVSPIPMPNAFATGRNPENSFIAATEGLFACGLTDAEIKGVLAHELAHVKSHDVAITSFTSVLASLFAILLSTGFPGFFHSAFVSKDDDLLDKLSNKVKTNKKGFVAPAVGIIGFFITLVLFWVISFFAKFVTLFVSRARESAADVMAVQWTGDPCSLSSALQKIVDWAERNALAMRLRILLDGMSPMLLVGIDEAKHGITRHAQQEESRFSRWWQAIGANHPPMNQRLAMLDTLAGHTCPSLVDVREQEEAEFEAMIRRKYPDMIGSSRRRRHGPRVVILTPRPQNPEESAEPRPEDAKPEETTPPENKPGEDQKPE